MRPRIPFSRLSAPRSLLANWRVGAGACLFAALPAGALAQGEVQQYKKLSLSELMEVEVISVSRSPQKLNEAASAIQVITGEEIQRSGATSLAEALRLAPNLQVAQVNSSQWAISARGFNNVLANKLLVMIDGRTVYTPLYAGVFWDVQNTLLQDVDRIEVVSGPGGALWGANAVNGVINIITKDASETQGLYVEAAGGNELSGHGGVRYGGKLSPTLSYRIYGMGTKRDDTVLLNDADARDDWEMSQGGMRIDWDPQAADKFTIQADIYEGRPNPDGGTTPVDAEGGNILGRWTHVFSPDSDFQLQWYYDRTFRDFGNGGFTEALDTWDFDGQHRFKVGERNEVTWGFGYRMMNHEVGNLPLFGFSPAERRLELYSLFLQDEILLVEDRLRLTLGAKLEHNDYTDLEVQPSVRLAWTPTAHQTFWAAMSRAVRTPARIDRDFYLLAAPTVPVLMGNPDFDSEDVLASEAGWRVQPHETVSVSLSVFYNEYDKLRSAEPGPPPANLPIMIGNGVEGHTYGTELSGTWQAFDWWRLRGGYTLVRKSLSLREGSQDLNDATAESDDPEHQVVLQSSMDFPRRVTLDVAVRYVDELTNRYVPSYVGVDVRVAWRPKENLELSVVGQNLLEPSHPEFVPSSPAPREIERSVYGKVAWWF